MIIQIYILIISVQHTVGENIIGAPNCEIIMMLSNY